MKQMQIDTIGRMVTDGHMTHHIAATLGEDPKEVAQCIKDHGFVVEKTHYTKECEPLLIRLYGEGMNASALKEKFGIGKPRVYGLVKKHGIYREPGGAFTLHSFNDRTFDVIDTPEKLYWLGVLFADGKNGGDGITLTSSHESMVRRFADFMGCKQSQVIQRGVNFTIQLARKHLSKVMLGHGLIIGDKLKDLKWPEWLTPETEMDFLRGYLDGKGSIKVTIPSGTYEQFALTTSGTDDMCRGIQTAVYRHTSHMMDILPGRNDDEETGEDSGRKRFEQTGNHQVFTVLNAVYAGATIFDEERHAKYLRLCIRQATKSR